MSTVSHSYNPISLPRSDDEPRIQDHRWFRSSVWHQPSGSLSLDRAPHTSAGQVWAHRIPTKVFSQLLKDQAVVTAQWLEYQPTKLEAVGSNLAGLFLLLAL